ncbi:SET domain-containing protein [Maridesulfovibrio sp.]|uniref:SET domain-containing protein n=1 Tax=Maridesulfovibrio sp. TaxID=2795000 RepID=UPI0029F58AAB|nr:SET domain-containing protein [Maridesulfovibrio sp.]
MIHPDTTVRTVSHQLGNGVFATRDIPCGTVVVVRDEYDLCLPYGDFQKLPEMVRQKMETHVYHDKDGMLVLSWDHARFMNHSCSCNTMMTDYRLEIAVRDIYAGEQITTEYGLLNVQEPYDIHCGCDGCRKRLKPDDIDNYGKVWDEMIKAALLTIPDVPQPLWDMVTPDIKNRLEALRLDTDQYSSVQNLKWRMDSI